MPPPSRTQAPKVVVTGLGLATGFGFGLEPNWRAIRQGRSAARFLDLPVAPGSPPYAGFPIPHPDKRPFQHLFKTALDVREDARLDDPSINPDRAATVVGFGKGDLHLLSRIHERFVRREPGFEQDLAAWWRTWPSLASNALAAVRGFRGPCLAPVAACATGVVAVIQAADLIRRGACDLALAGAGDSTLEPLVLAAFRNMGVLADVPGGNDPTRAVRPWNRDRSGFLVGEGGALLVLEREDHARARGVLPYAEVAGGAIGGDAHHITGLDPDPSHLASLIALALERSGVAPDEIDHVNVHGTATKANDPLECRALRLALGARADHVACSANKSQIGHLLGAAGAAELVLTCLAIRDGFVPPTLNLTDPDPVCDLDGTPHVGRSRPIRAALKLSIGFGGHLAAIVLRQVDGPRREG